MAEGVDGRLGDKTRPPGKAPVAEDKTSTVVAMTLKPPPHEATHGTGSRHGQSRGARPLPVSATLVRKAGTVACRDGCRRKRPCETDGNVRRHSMRLFPATRGAVTAAPAKRGRRAAAGRGVRSWPDSWCKPGCGASPCGASPYPDRIWRWRWWIAHGTDRPAPP